MFIIKRQCIDFKVFGTKINLSLKSVLYKLKNKYIYFYLRGEREKERAWQCFHPQGHFPVRAR